MSWNIQFTRQAVKDLEKILIGDRKLILDKIEKLINKSDLGKQLVGPLKGLRSLRLRKYRIIYKKEKSDLIILIIAIGLRKDIYR